MISQPHSTQKRKSGARSLISVVLAAVLGVSLVLVPGAAMAGTSYGTVGTFKKVGKTFKARSWIQTGSGTDHATVRIESKSGSLKAGHLGALARGYKAGGALTCTSGYFYTPTSAPGLQKSCGFSAKAKTNYYSKGAVRVKSGSSYYTYTTKASPYQTGP